MPQLCLASAKLCAVRVTRLNADCTVAVGANNAVASKAIVRLAATPEYDTGQEFIQKNGCGDICVSLKDCDQLKRMNLELELCLRDMEMIEILTGARLQTQTVAGVAGTTAAISRRGIGAPCPSKSVIEIWTRAVDTSGACTPSTNPQWWRTVYPAVTLTLGPSTFENGIATVQMTGYSEANANLAIAGANPQFGPFNDWGNTPTPITLAANEPEMMFLSAAPPTLGCGYTSVPAGVPAQ